MDARVRHTNDGAWTTTRTPGLSSWLLGLAVAAALLPQLAGAQAPFPPLDTSDATTRTVRIWIDDNPTDPSSVGGTLQFAFEGTWTSDGTTGTITVVAADVLSAFATSGLPGSPALTGTWTDLVITMTIATGAITSMSQSGTIALSGLGNQPFTYDLNTTLFDTQASLAYTQSGFAPVTFGPETFTGWCTNTNPGVIVGLACPPYAGPAPFGYNPVTGRFNAIGSTNVNSFIFAYSTFGDAQLFEDALAVPALPLPWLAAAVVSMLAVGRSVLRAGSVAR